MRFLVLILLCLSVVLTGCLGTPAAAKPTGLGDEYLQMVAESNAAGTQLNTDWRAATELQAASASQLANAEAKIKLDVSELLAADFALNVNLSVLDAQLPKKAQGDVAKVRKDLAREITDLQAALGAISDQHLYIELGAWGQDGLAGNQDWTSLRSDMGLKAGPRQLH